MSLALPDRAGATRVILIRHTEPSEVDGRCYGSLDVGLSVRGRARARAIARALASMELAAVYSSPLRRALETAGPVASVHGLSPIPSPAFRELDFGELEGRRYDEIARERPELFRTWMDDPTAVRFPAGESFSDFSERVRVEFESVRGHHVGEEVGVVAHGGVTRTILAAALGVPDAAIFRLDQSYGGVSVVDWISDTPVVRVVNGIVD